VALHRVVLVLVVMLMMPAPPLESAGWSAAGTQQRQQ
jgi:hypothetical protein